MACSPPWHTAACSPAGLQAFLGTGECPTLHAWTRSARGEFFFFFLVCQNQSLQDFEVLHLGQRKRPAVGMLGLPALAVPEGRLPPRGAALPSLCACPERTRCRPVFLVGMLIKAHLTEQVFESNNHIKDFFSD